MVAVEPVAPLTVCHKSTWLSSDHWCVNVRHSSEEAITILNSELSRLTNWSSINELYVRSSKKNRFCYVRNCTEAESMWRCSTWRQSAKWEAFPQILWIVFGHLTFKEHTTGLFNKISSQLKLLSEIRNIITILVTEWVFKLMILPKLDYCNYI